MAGAPREIDLQVGAGMQPRLTPVAAKIGSGRRPENAFVRSGYGLIGSSDPKAVIPHGPWGMTHAPALLAREVRTFVMPPAWRPRPAP